ncbi:26986_t:CDS:2 [Dentiscutata erythropus]|uniref:26986_t:CDS:1 n=1 Tax=Dentiscutata erythropus TaxID=1348616 RepID=A0A9N9NX14_9GLOM|nr:26986_t:CDS:2 [Dentiscutata erythropus]
MPKLKNNLCQLSKKESFNFHTVLFTTNNETILTRKSIRESNFTESSYTTDDGFVIKDAQKNSFSSIYITKQNGTIVENNIFFSNEELQIDDSDNDSDLITEEEALFNIELYKNINN